MIFLVFWDIENLIYTQAAPTGLKHTPKCLVYFHKCYDTNVEDAIPVL